MRRFFTTLLVMAMGAATAWVWHRERPGQGESAAFLQRRMALLEGENARLREHVQGLERTRREARELEVRRGIEEQVTNLRDLPFLQPVDYAVVTKQEIKGVVAGKMAELYQPAEFDVISRSLQRFGLLPEGFPLLQKYQELLGEQIAAFYDQHQHKLYMFADATLQKGQNRVILAHELTHALQDQHFGLRKLPLEIKDNDDRALAASALAEGDATVLMNQYLAESLSPGSLMETMGSAMGQSMEQLTGAPRFLRECLLFPYLRGQAFAMAVFEEGGWGALNAAYKNPPASTTQILHPEKFLATPREDPLAIQWPADATWRGEQPTLRNVLGELAIGIQLNPERTTTEATQAAAGWRGDGYLWFEKGNALVWKSIWASPEEAQQFLEAETAALSARYGARTPGLELGFEVWTQVRHVRLGRLGERDVLMVDAPTEEAARELWLKFAGSEVGR